jgi:demethylmenaquinone methyltransferase/2-methoxy-6-polyprenyl-1,4-benzoquinol methylase
MFADIAPRYDLLNGVLSFGMDRLWRRRAAALAEPPWGGAALDVCCGTGDMTRDLARLVGSEGKCVGVDFCTDMLVRASRRKPIDSAAVPVYIEADAHDLPFAAKTFDCVTIAFGIRNVTEPVVAFTEMARVIRPGGRAVCLEFGLPSDPARSMLVRLYEGRVMPQIGALLSRRQAYEYLSDSIAAFATPEEVRAMMEAVGFGSVRTISMNMGSVYLHAGVRL